MSLRIWLFKLGMVVGTYNPSTWEAETGGLDHRFEASLSNLTRPYSKIKNKSGVVAHACNPSTWEAETGGSRSVASLSYLVRPSATL